MGGTSYMPSNQGMRSTFDQHDAAGHRPFTFNNAQIEVGENELPCSKASFRDTDMVDEISLKT